MATNDSPQTSTDRKSPVLVISGRRRWFLGSTCACLLTLLAFLLSLQTVKLVAATNNDAANNNKTAVSLLMFANLQQHQQDKDDSIIKQLLTNSSHDHMSDTVNITLANSIWKKMSDNALKFAHLKAKQSRPIVNDFLNQANVSDTCKESLNHIIDHTASLTKWAVQMWNSFGDFPSTGLFHGTLNSIGNYQECVEIEPNEYIGKPQYCSFAFAPVIPTRPKYHTLMHPIKNLANFTNNNDMLSRIAKDAQYFWYIKLRIATCMPSKCSRQDIESLGKQAAINTYMQFGGVKCLEKKVGFHPDFTETLALSILISLASVAVAGTLIHLLNIKSYFVQNSQDNISALLVTKGGLPLSNQKVDLVAGKQRKLLATSQDKIQQTCIASQRHQLSPPRRNSQYANTSLTIINFLLHFSIVRNARKLFDTTTSRNGGSLATALGNDHPADHEDVGKKHDISCVHGLRFWTITWIIFGHTMQYTEWSGFGSVFEVKHTISSFLLHPFLNATFSVDTFFLISGLLTTYVTWSITHGQYKRFNKFAFLISRYLRLTPQVMLVILFMIIFPMMGDGPFWEGMIRKESDNCKQNWWVNALYLQAFVKSDKICNLVTWWLSIEMFFHFVSIFFILAMLQSTRKGLFIATFLGGLMTAFSCYLHFTNGYPPNMLPTILQKYEMWHSLVLKYFWTPFPHAAAYFVGLVLGCVLFNKNVKLTRIQVKLGWTLSTITYVMILYGTYYWNNGVPYSRFISTAYYNTSQVAWAFATGWTILACALGHGGWVNRFLSAPIFVPLGRATYMTYLSHMLIVYSYPARMNLLIEPTHSVFLYIIVTNLFLSYSLGILLTLIYESPILHLQKLLVGRMAGRYSTSPLIQMNADTDKDVKIALYPQESLPTNGLNHDQILNNNNNKDNNNTMDVNYNNNDEDIIIRQPAA